ncbi:hypothetical protein K2173_008177 [Erythroxylum novogranatense]|uniref:Ty3 transposon capsid-like protein domain-containing protein n=1 Tax=Erythroxylum novogranatense TaxID=1862640 RepID=A0AAV8UCM5_9ROSI|nr:hypothetical protein K2173_008177 [Erythroxylum novogranatense]
MAGEFHEGSPSSKSQDDVLLAIQNLTLEIRTNRQEHLVLSQRVDQVYSILEAKAFLNPQNKGVLGNHPFGPRRNPQRETVDDNVDSDTTPVGRAPNIRIDAPKFNGTDPLGWVYKVQSYFDYFRTPEEDRLRLVGLLFESPASDWFLYQHNNNCVTSWYDFLEAVKQRFDPAHYEDYMGLLSKLQQRTTVMEYQAEFERLLNKISGVSETTLISIFKAGLKPPIRREVNLRNPLTLGQTFALARELAANYTDTMSSLVAGGHRPWQTTTTKSVGTNMGTLQLRTPSVNVTPAAAPQATPSGISTLPIRKLSLAEREECTSKGLCWNCDEKYVPGHCCKHRFLALLGTDDWDDEQFIEPLMDDLMVMSGMSQV